MEVSGSNSYISGCLLEFGEEWYHGELTREDAEQALKASGCDCFLIRHCQGDLFLSLTHNTKIDHAKIDYGPGWYKLNSAPHQKFSELQQLVNHYCDNPISAEGTLSTACVKRGEMKDQNTGLKLN